jgi:hypothetical protein
MRSGDRDDGDVEPLFPADTLQFADVIDGNSASRLVPDLLVRGVEERCDLESFLSEPGIVGERESEVAGAHDRDPQVSIETQDLTQMPPQVFHVIADAADTKFAEVRQVLANLGGVEMELLGQRLRRDRLGSGRVELIQAAQVHRQAVCSQFRHLVGGLTPLVRPIHKMKWYCKVLELVVGALLRLVRGGFSAGGLRRTVAVAAVSITALVLVAPTLSAAQPPPRRLATIAALRQFPGFFHLQNVLLRGGFKEEGGRFSLEADDGNIRVILDSGVRTPSGAVEVRGQLVDIGRLEPGDPRVPEAEQRDATRWPRPGEELVLRVTAVNDAAPSASTTIRALALEPWRYEGQKVTVTGNFRGRNLFGDLPGAPGKSRYDFVIRGAEGAMWVSGLQPRGRGFDLDIDRRFDTDQWLEVTGVVAYERGLVRLDATQLTAAKAPQVIREADEPAAPPPVLPVLEVVFSSPTPDEENVAATSVVRIQFSRGLDPKTFAGAVRVSYPGSDATPPMFQTTYEAATRALTLRFSAPLQAGRVQVEVLEALKAFDGGAARPWTLTFSVGE